MQGGDADPGDPRPGLTCHRREDEYTGIVANNQPTLREAIDEPEM